MRRHPPPNAYPTFGDILVAIGEDRVGLLREWVKRAELWHDEDLVQAISRAVKLDRVECLGVLLDFVAQPPGPEGWLEARPNWKTALWQALLEASETGKVECLRLLMPHTDPAEDHSLALTRAAGAGHLSCVEALLPHSNPKACASRALLMAAAQGHDPVVQRLWTLSEPRAALRMAQARQSLGQTGEVESMLRYMANEEALVLRQAVNKAPGRRSTPRKRL